MDDLLRQLLAVTRIAIPVEGIEIEERGMKVFLKINSHERVWAEWNTPLARERELRGRIEELKRARE